MSRCMHDTIVSRDPMNYDHYYQWDTDTFRNNRQLQHNRDSGDEHAPVAVPRSVRQLDETVYLIYRIGFVEAVCYSWKSVKEWLRSEEREYRYVGVQGNRWIADRYMGGSGPCGQIIVEARCPRP